MIKFDIKTTLILIFITLILIVLSYYFFFSYPAMKPELFYNTKNKFAQLILEKCSVLNEKFSPAFWATSCFMQTVIPFLIRNGLDQMNYTREILTCPDGGIVSLDWFEDASISEEKSPIQPAEPIALLFPGLIGDSQSDYLRNIVPRLKNVGYRVVAFNNRGRGGMELRSPRLYCAANIEDYDLAINHLRGNNPSTKIVATGFSMGAMLLTRYLAEKQTESKVDAAMLVSGNYDLVNGTKNMETGWFNRFIARLMTKELTKIIMADQDIYMKANKPVQWDKLEKADTFRELDAYFTCPMWGYPDPDAYFLDCTNNQRMKKITVPTLCLNSADDMFSPRETLPLYRLSDTTVFAVTEKGGHLGFADGWPTLPYYGDRLIEQFYTALKSVDSIKELQETET